MGGLFGGSKPPPGPSKEEIEKQEDREERAEAGESREKRKIASKARSRRSGGNRLLMSQERDNPALGNEMGDTTLGPGRNPRA
tara:strand:- start:14464 stop:14712 length:249 start_codon:yes stop_codon:yes gene_type:complete